MNEGSIIQSVSPNDKELWCQFQQGNEAALASLYSRYFDHLYNYGFKFTQDVTLVEACIQELFIKLIRNRQNLSLPDSVKNYLFKAYRSYMFDRMEKLKKYPTQDLNESMDFELDLHRESGLIVEEEQVARGKKLNEAIQELTPRQKEAIFLRYQEGLSYPAIAEMLSLSQKATYKLIGRAIQALRSATGSRETSRTIDQKNI